MLRYHKGEVINYNLQKGQNLHYTDYSLRIRLSTADFCSSQILGFLHSKGHTSQRLCDRRDMPWQTLSLPQVPVQHWEFGWEATGDGASGTSLSLPLLPSDPTATPQEVRYTARQVQMGHCTAHFSMSLLLWLENLWRHFCQKMVTMPNFDPIRVQQNTTLTSMLLGMQWTKGTTTRRYMQTAIEIPLVQLRTTIFRNYTWKQNVHFLGFFPKAPWYG